MEQAYTTMHPLYISYIGLCAYLDIMYMFAPLFPMIDGNRVRYQVLGSNICTR